MLHALVIHITPALYYFPSSFSPYTRPSIQSKDYETTNCDVLYPSYFFHMLTFLIHQGSDIIFHQISQVYSPARVEALRAHGCRFQISHPISTSICIPAEVLSPNIRGTIIGTKAKPPYAHGVERGRARQKQLL